MKIRSFVLTVAAAVVVIVGSEPAPADAATDVGWMCRAVQREAQLAFGNRVPASRKEHGELMQDLSELLRGSNPPLTRACTGCITSQFANGTAVAQQRACGFHDVCVIGDALKESTGACVAAVCAADDRCCKTVWGPDCVALVQTACGRTCQACAHDLCVAGASLRRVCGTDECARDVCATDPYCCDTAWDETCVQEAVTTCGCTLADSETRDGRDDDCDGRSDEGFRHASITCGAGDAPGLASCSDGQPTDNSASVRGQ
jgi:hypothetical protein